MKKIVMLLIAILLISICFLSGCVEESSEKTSNQQSSTFLDVPQIPETPSIPEGTPHGWKMEYTEIFFNDFESSNPELGLDFSNYAELTDNAIDGEKSVKISNLHSLDTNPEELPLLPDTYYMFEFDYHILNRGSNDDVIIANYLYPKGSDNNEDSIHCLPILTNANEEGKFSSGVLTTSNSDAYYLKIQSKEDASIIIDNLRMYRLDPIPTTSASSKFSTLSELPFPRLGNYIGGASTSWADSSYSVPNWSERYVFTAEEVEERLAFFDIVAGPHVNIQSQDTSFVKRLQQKNPNIIVMPYTNYIITSYLLDSPYDTIDPDYEFYNDFPDEWIMKHTNGSNVGADLWPGLFNTNIYDSCPVVNRQTYNEAITDHMINTVMASGYWDGLFIDNVFAETSHYVPNYMNPSLFDYDVNLNGERDETIAQVSELTRPIMRNFLQRLKDEVGNNEMIIVNNGWNLDYTVAPYVNGINFELFINPWNLDQSQPNELAWRRFLNDYFAAQKLTLEPHLNILEAGGGGTVGYGAASKNYLEPTAEDIEKHRFSLGTALLNDGFYEYDLYDMGSVPYWFDEYTVNEEGVATEDTQYKGYLGMPLADAVELKSTSTLIWEEDFDSTSLPSSMQGDSEVFVENNKLVIDNPDHTSYNPEGITANTKYGEIPFESKKTYVIEFDWEILDTLDDRVRISIGTNKDLLASSRLHGIFEGDSNHEHFHITIPYDDEYQLKFSLQNGGGKIVIDNIKIYEGGAGPWRRDFENGFALVNPINKEYTFSAEELAGEHMRTGIKRILGTQAPDVNNGEPVTGSLTLQSFDAIILLADTIHST